MMRPGDKLKSYQILAQALRAIPDMPWQLVVAGDGQARDAVMQAFTWALPDRVRFLGLVQPEVMPALYAACDLLVWPAVNEAFRSEEHTSELQSLMRISYAVFCLKIKNNIP